MKTKAIESKNWLKMSIVCLFMGVIPYILMNRIENQQLRAFVGCIGAAIATTAVIALVIAVVYFIVGIFSPELAAGKGPLGAVLFVVWMILIALSA